MKKITFPILAGLLLAACARADTPLTITSQSPYGCLQNAYLYPTPLQVNGSFTLSGVNGSGLVQSSVPAAAPTFGFPPQAYFFNYSIDMSRMSSPANHCVKLVIHFGTPQGCGYQEVFGSPSAIQSATMAPFGDITFVFNGGCLTPGQPAVGFLMFSEAAPKTNIVTIIDDYVDAKGTTNETRINVPAIVPDIPPNPPVWVLYHPNVLPYPWFQGNLDLVGTNQTKTNLPVSGPYDFTVQLLNSASNSLAVSQVITQTVQVANGLFNLPLPFDPISMGDGSVRWLSVGVRSSGLPAVQFTPVSPPLPLAPTPQALYAYSAGVVADLTPGQAVTSLNGLTDAVNLQAGNGILLDFQGNTITISAQPGTVSDRALKADFTSVNPEAILAKLAGLPILGWRYTNEVAGVRHVGPMAQDFKAAFGLGESEKMISFVDEQGVALAAIQGLNQKLEQKDTEITELKQRLDKLNQVVDQLNQKLNGGER